MARTPRHDAPHGTIERRGSRRYRARYPDPRGTLTESGRRVQIAAPRSFETRADAEAWLRAEWQLIQYGDWTPPAERAARAAAATVTLGEYWPRFMQRRGYRPSSAATNQSVFRNRLEVTFGDVALADVTPAMVRDWWAKVRAEHPDTGKRNHDAAVLLKALFNDAVRDGLVSVNPVDIETRRPRSAEKPIPTREQLAAIVDGMPDHLKAPTLVMAWCALRIGEAAALQRGDVERVTTGGQARVYLHVRRTGQRVGGQWVEGPPKTEAGARRVPVPPAIVGELDRHMRRFTAPGKASILFPNAHGGHLVRQRYGAVLARRAEAAGCPGVTPHSLRHAAATHWAIAGANVAELQSLMGHETPDMALHYTHVAAGRLEELSDAISCDLDHT